MSSHCIPYCNAESRRGAAAQRQRTEVAYHGRPKRSYGACYGSAAYDPMQQLELWGPRDAEHGWSIRQSARARRLSVRVFRHGSVEVVVPLRTPSHRISAFIRPATGRGLSVSDDCAVAPLPWLLPPAMIGFELNFDERWRCLQRPDSGRVRLRATTAGELELRGDLSDRRALRRVLIRWLVEYSKERFVQPLAALAAQVGVGPQRLQVRCQRTRWGSCSRRGTISLNACLLLFSGHESCAIC